LRLLFLRHHPLKEVRNIADAIEKAVTIKHPNSFSNKRYEATEAYQDEIAKEYYYHEKNTGELTIDTTSIDREKLKKSSNLFEKRPQKTELPAFLNDLGQIECKFKLDFGSYRDLQRHRALDQRMPLITFDLGFNEFYVDSLSEQLQEKARTHLKETQEMIEKLNLEPTEKQYLIPIGFNCAVFVRGTIPAFVYMLELRATRFVHQTLREKAEEIAKHLQKDLNIKMWLDKASGMFDIKRGEHDIEIKN